VVPRILLAVLDEVGFYRDENSSSPDTELYRSLVPGTATLNGQIIGISSPFMSDVIMEIVAGRVIHGFVSATDNAALQVQNLTLEALIIEKLYASIAHTEQRKRCKINL
jgi:hypothetical protein